MVAFLQRCSNMPATGSRCH